MIATVDPPLKGRHEVTGEAIAIIALGFQPPHAQGPLPLGYPVAFYVDAEGRMGVSHITDLTVDWRFDREKQRWLDVEGDGLSFPEIEGDEVGREEGT